MKPFREKGLTLSKKTILVFKATQSQKEAHTMWHTTNTTVSSATGTVGTTVSSGFLLKF